MNTDTTSTLTRILEQAPYIASSVDLGEEYDTLGNLSIPKDLYICRGGVQAMTPHRSAGLYIPDDIKDRHLMKVFESIPNRIVDFGTFHRRVRTGKETVQAATTPLLTVSNRTLREYYNNYPNPQVGYYLFVIRVKKLSWTKETSISTPKRTSSEEKPLISYFDARKHQAKVDYATFYARIKKLGWSKEDALSQPYDIRYNRKCAVRLAYECAATPPTVSFAVAYARVNKLGWDFQRAVSVPVTA